MTLIITSENDTDMIFEDTINAKLTLLKAIKAIKIILLFIMSISIIIMRTIYMIN